MLSRNQTSLNHLYHAITDDYADINRLPHEFLSVICMAASQKGQIEVRIKSPYYIESFSSAMHMVMTVK